MTTTILFFHGYRKDVNKVKTSKAYDLLESLLQENSTAKDELRMSFINWQTNNVINTVEQHLNAAKISIKNNENFVLIGHSCGGNIATMIHNKLQQEKLYSKLVLINPLIDKTTSNLPIELLQNLNADYSKIQDSEIILSIFDNVTKWQIANRILHENNGVNFENQHHQITTISDKTASNILNYIHKQL